jgi:hypothetical protein
MTAFTVSAASAAQPAAASNSCQAGVDRLVTVPDPTKQATVTGVRIGKHEGEAPRYDRLVFDLTEPLKDYRVEYVSQLIDIGGNPVRLAGNAFLHVRFSGIAHDDNGHSTITTPPTPVVNWGALRQVGSVTDFEGVVDFGIGLRSTTDFVVSTLANPNRLVIDVAVPGQHPWVCNTGAVKVYFFDPARFAANTEPYVTSVWRRVSTPAVAAGALTAMFNGPTDIETARGLKFVSSAAWGFYNLSIANGIARVQLVAGCNAAGSTFSIAGEIEPTLKQFSSVRWVKIYDPEGETFAPNGNTDSLPDCLNP